MSGKKTPTARFARAARTQLARVDVRLLVAFVSVGGVLAWTLPWQGGAVFFLTACAAAATAAVELKDGRAALAAYGLFVLLWTTSQLLLFLFENPGRFEEAVAVSALLGARLFTLLGLALLVPLVATPLLLGRTLTWYLRWLVVAEAFVCRVVFRNKARPFLAENVWRAALALTLMAAFFPRSLRAAAALRRSLALRAPRLPLYKKAALMGLALLRVVGAQTWDMALAVASRDLYRPEPWEWPKP